MFRGSYRFTLVAVLLSLGIAAAQAAPAKAEKPQKATKAAKTPSPPTVPPPAITLEPKAIDILKAACSRLAAAKSTGIHDGALLRESQSLGRAAGVHDEVRGCLTAAG